MSSINDEMKVLLGVRLQLSDLHSSLSRFSMQQRYLAEEISLSQFQDQCFFVIELSSGARIVFDQVAAQPLERVGRLFSTKFCECLGKKGKNRCFQILLHFFFL